MKRLLFIAAFFTALMGSASASWALSDYDCDGLDDETGESVGPSGVCGG